MEGVMWVACDSISFNQVDEMSFSGYSRCILLLLLPVRVVPVVFRCPLNISSQSGDGKK